MYLYIFSRYRPPSSSFKMSIHSLETRIPCTYSRRDLWSFFGDRGVYSVSPSVFFSAFDFIHHYQGAMIYKLKSKEEISQLSAVPDPGEETVVFFKGCVLSDPMQSLVTKEEFPGQCRYTLLFTHDDDGQEIDVIENHVSFVALNFKDIERYLTKEQITYFSKILGVTLKYSDEEADGCPCSSCDTL